jgi:organic hydroperoxide reductase OsmC/OhrA
MTVLKREATIRWLNHPPKGTPRLTVGSDSLTPSLPLDVDRYSTHPLAASPGELLAGAIGAIFASFTAEELVREGTQARELTTSVTLTVSGDGRDGADLVLSAVACQMWARGPSIDQAQLEIAAKAAMTRCFEALAMRAERIALTVEAVLESS